MLDYTSFDIITLYLKSEHYFKTVLCEVHNTQVSIVTAFCKTFHFSIVCLSNQIIYYH